VFCDSQAAASLGAVLPPSIKGKMIGNYDVLQELLGEFQSGYPGNDRSCFSDFFILVSLVLRPVLIILFYRGIPGGDDDEYREHF
jgi:hypothetical protein